MNKKLNYGTFVKVLGKFISLGLLSALSYGLGPDEFGLYVFAMALISLIAAPAQFGIATLVSKETAKLTRSKSQGKIKSLWIWADNLLMLSCVIIVTLITVVITLTGIDVGELNHFHLILIGLLVFLTASLQLNLSKMKGLFHPTLAQSLDAVARPGLFLFCFLVMYLLLSDIINSTNAIILHSLSYLLVYAFTVIYLSKYKEKNVAASLEFWVTTKMYFPQILPIALIASMNLINRNVDIISIGWFMGSADVAEYKAALVLCALISLPLQVVSAVIGPYFSRDSSVKNYRGIQKKLQDSMKFCFLYGLPLFVVITLFAGFLVKIIFGFNLSNGIFVIFLALAHLANLVFGVVGLLLTMTGHAGAAAKAALACGIVNISLNTILVPAIGLSGAALATLISYILWNLLLWRAVIVSLGINTFKTTFWSNS